MRKLLILCAALISVSLPASAQDATAGFDAASPASEPAAPASLIPADRDPWQLGVGFQYLHYDELGLNFHNLGYQADITRYFNNWFGVEGTLITGFGHAGSNPSIDAKSLFLGGGAHVSILNTRHLEPWAHLLVGWDHLRLTQSATYGSNSHAAFFAGGGLDYKIGGGRIYWRIQGDYIGTNFGPKNSADYAFGTGLVFNF